jgi:aspartate aminotransferase
VKFLPEEICAANGGKQSIFHFFQVLLEKGDEVLIPTPYWTSFPEMVKMVGAVPKIVSPKQGRLKASELEAAITSKTKLFILNSPSNPSGLYFSEEELRSFAVVLEKHKIWTMSDDTYYALVYPPHRWTSILKLAPELRQRTCVIGSLSKSYAMTGWRLGWAAGPKALIDAIIKVQGQVTSGPSSISQAAGVAALTSEHRFAAEFRGRYEQRRRVVLEALRAIPGLKVPEPEGAFYSFFDLSDRISAAKVTEFCSFILEKHGVCLIPGEAFGEPGCVRLTYSLSEAEILEGVARIKKALEDFQSLS